MRTLNARLSAVLLLLLLFLGAVSVALTLRTSRMHMQEVQQKLHRELAAHIVADQPLLQDPVGREDVLDATFEKLMVINPDLEVYLLGPEGRVLAYSAPPGHVRQEQVAVAPIIAFLGDSSRLPILGTDPRSPGRGNIFSAAPILSDGKLTGYLYIVLASEQLGDVATMLRGSYVLRAALSMVAGSLLVALAGGSLVFRRLTGRLRRLSREMADFAGRVSSREGGAAESRRRAAANDDDATGDGGGDEIDRLERSFRSMAQQIDRQLAELQEQDEKRRQLLANISHDVRTPLTHLQGYLETLLIKGEMLAPDGRREYLQIAARRAEQLGRLVSDLFELGKLSVATETLDKEPFPIAELAQDVAQGFKLASAGRDIVIDVPAGDTPILVNANLGIIERVLQNLIENAFRHTRPGDRITVAVAQRQGSAQVSVRDSGPGIAADALPHIFDRHFHRETGAGGDSSGSGLGLAIAKRGLELHGAPLRCDSELGVGTTFRFELGCVPMTIARRAPAAPVS